MAAYCAPQEPLTWRLQDVLNHTGICAVAPPYSADEMVRLNAALDPLLHSRRHEHRAYVHVDELHDLGILDALLSPRMRHIVFSLIPDAVLYHCHVYEIAARDTRSHIFGDTLSGWHHDTDCELVPGKLTHASVFVYLSDVGPDDGPFEFVPRHPSTWLRSGMPCLSVTGPAGFTFAWHRSYFHRASPNRSPTRRRLFKISIQANAYRSVHLANPHFRRLVASVPAGEPQLDLLLGRYQAGVAPSWSSPQPRPDPLPLTPNVRLEVPNLDLVRFQLRERARALKHRFSVRKGESPLPQYE